MTAEVHAGGCHCGAIRYEATIDLAAPVIVCNCSICAMKGLMLSFVAGDGVTLNDGASQMETYRFNAGKIAHRFCKRCGVEVFGQVEGSGSAINVRTLDGVDLDALTLQPFDGRSA
jgi:hypothetical protein